MKAHKQGIMEQSVSGFSKPSCTVLISSIQSCGTHAKDLPIKCLSSPSNTNMCVRYSLPPTMHNPHYSESPAPRGSGEVGVSKFPIWSLLIPIHNIKLLLQTYNSNLSHKFKQHYWFLELLDAVTRFVILSLGINHSQATSYEFKGYVRLLFFLECSLLSLLPKQQEQLLRFHWGAKEQSIANLFRCLEIPQDFLRSSL